jgi:alpha-1,3-rhamnosyl/mannosyltransferase
MAAVTVDISPFLVNSAGVKTYLYHWLRAMREEASGIEIRTYPVEYSDEPLRHDRSLFGLLKTGMGIARLGLSNRFPAAAPRGQIFHATQLMHRLPTAHAVTTTLHDLTYRLFPGMHTEATLECHRRFDAEVLPQCRRVLCVSAATAADAARSLRIPEERLIVTHQGVDDRFFGADPSEARAALQLPEQFILCLGTIEPRKNTIALLEAYLGLPEDVRAAFPLLFAGGAGWKSQEALARIRLAEANVRYLGYVPEEHLPGVVAAATMLAYPSLYEGFGIPLAQAMAAGTPVLTSNVSSMPEVAGEAALLIDPRSVESIREGLLRLTTSPELRRELVEKGWRRVEEFRWSVCARKSLQVFAELAGEL